MASKVRMRLVALPGSVVPVEAAKESPLARARRQVKAARLAGKTPDARDVTLVRDADRAEAARKAAQTQKVLDDAEAKAAQRRRVRAARIAANVHDVLPVFACSPVAHCPRQAELAQCAEFVQVIQRHMKFQKPIAAC